MELLGNENDVLEKAVVKLVNEVDVGNEGNNILGCRGNIEINRSVDYMVVETIDDVLA